MTDIDKRYQEIRQRLKANRALWYVDDLLDLIDFRALLEVEEAASEFVGLANEVRNKMPTFSEESVRIAVLFDTAIDRLRAALKAREQG